MDKLTKILESLELDLAGPIRWQEVRATLFRTPEWHRDPELQRMEPIDMLTVVEDEVRRAEKELAEQRQRLAEEKRRRARKAREDYSVRPVLLFRFDDIEKRKLIIHFFPQGSPFGTCRRRSNCRWYDLEVNLPSHRFRSSLP
jgi:hypothetical protein